MVEFLSKLVEVPSTDPDEARRRRLLNTLLLSTAVIVIIGLVAAVVYDLLELEPEAYRLYYAGAITLTGRWSKESEIPTATTITGEAERLTPDIEATLLRATQEALANIRKHAAAQIVTATLS